MKPRQIINNSYIDKQWKEINKFIDQFVNRRYKSVELPKDRLTEFEISVLKERGFKIVDLNTNNYKISKIL